MELSVSQQGRAGRFLVEAFVIVSSILIAFGIDAWWDDRKDRLEEREVLAGLHREFTDYRDGLERGLAQHNRMLDGMTAVLTSIEKGEWTSSEWGIDEAVGQLVTPPTSDLGNGVRDALVQGGRLELVSNPMLRERLAQWPSFHDELVDDQLFSRELVLVHLLPFLSRQGLNLSTVLVAGTMVVEPNTDPWPVTLTKIGDDPAAIRRLLTDAEFRSLVEMRYSYWHHAGGEYRSALRAAQEILGLLDEAIR